MKLFLALLAIAYIGSMLMRGRGLRGYGLPSGSEWVLLGVAAGPHVMGWLDEATLRTFDPLAGVAVGWIALVFGALSVGGVRSSPRLRASVTGASLAALTVAGVTALAYLAAANFTDLRGTALWIAAAGVALASCETTRHAVDWVVQRHAAHGPLSEFVGHMAARDDGVPLVLIAIPFALAGFDSPASMPWFAWALGSVALGAILGATCAALLNFERRLHGAWGIVLGAALLTSGIAWGTGLSALAAMLVLGASLAQGARHRAEVQETLARTEHAVLLPVLLLAGARVPIDLDLRAWLVISVACGGRALLCLVAAPIIARLARPERPPGLALGLGLLPTGGVTMTVGLAFMLRFPDTIGSLVLCTAATQTVIGEVLGSAALYSALVHAGEVEEPAARESGRAARGAT